MSKLTELLRDVAPALAGTIGTAVGGPLGPLAAHAVSFLGEKLLGKPNATLQEVEAHVENMTPTQLIELRKIDNEFEIRMKELGYKPMELEAQDRDSARRMQTAALGQDDPVAKRFVYYYAMFWSAWGVIYLTAVTFMTINVQNMRIVDTILGFILGTLISTLVGFFYGTSYSERGARKREDITVRTIKSTP